MNVKLLTIQKNRLPHWTLDGSYYLITYRLAVSNLKKHEVAIALNHIKSGHDKYYSLIAAQIMPDHVHMILKPIIDYKLYRVVKGIKGVTARMINVSRKTQGTVWMKDYHDRIIRSESDLSEKLNYLFYNPVRAEIVTDPERYNGWYLHESEGSSDNMN